MTTIFPYKNVEFNDYNKFLDLDTQLSIDDPNAEETLLKLVQNWNNIYSKQWDDIKKEYFGVTDSETISFVDMGIIWILSTGNVIVDNQTYDPPYGIGSCNTTTNIDDVKYKTFCAQQQWVEDGTKGNPTPPKYPKDMRKSCNIYNTNYCNIFSSKGTCNNGGCIWDGSKCNKIQNDCGESKLQWQCNNALGCTWNGDWAKGTCVNDPSKNINCEWVSFYETQKNVNMDKNYTEGGCSSCAAALAIGAQEDSVAKPGTTYKITDAVWDVQAECKNTSICITGGPFQTSSAYVPMKLSSGTSFKCDICVGASNCGQIVDGVAQGGLQNPLCAARIASNYANMCTNATPDSGNSQSRCTFSSSWDSYSSTIPPKVKANIDSIKIDGGVLSINYSTSNTMLKDSSCVNEKGDCSSNNCCDGLECSNKKCIKKFHYNYCTIDRMQGGPDANCVFGCMPETSLGWNSPPCEQLYRTGGEALDQYPFCTLSIWASRAAKYSIYRVLIKLNKTTLAENFKKNCDVDNALLLEACKNHMTLDDIKKNNFNYTSFPRFCPQSGGCKDATSRSCFCNTTTDVNCYTK